MSTKMFLSTKDIRKRFLKFFEKKNHKILPSSPVVPYNDPTLMFTSAGMVQFKNIFLGLESPPSPRVATIQKCLRAGGKHNDIEQIGKTKRHHTFFEMLGNFSFNSYFKKEAIIMAWEFLTEEINLDPAKMTVTVHKKDPETLKIWLSIISREKIVIVDSNDNFWAMGDIGPCGYCTEIFYDLGSQYNGVLSEQKYDPDERFLEIWNIVFMEFKQLNDRSVVNLDKKYIDTGIGLERLASVCQNVTDNYSIDLFKKIMKKSMEFDKNCSNIVPHKIISDHARACAFMIADGVVPSNIGAGYVLRRIMRRAINQSHKINSDVRILSEVTTVVMQEMQEEYQEIKENSEIIRRYIEDEEKKFTDVLIKGLAYLNENIDLSSKTASPELIFKLYDTYGFPTDLTKDILLEKSISYDFESVTRLMEDQKNRGKKSWHGKTIVRENESHLNNCEKTKLEHHNKEETTSIILGIIDKNQNICNYAKEKTKVTIVLDTTPFYGESGGQIGDRGEFYDEYGKLIAKVLDTQLTLDKKIAMHKCETIEKIELNKKIIAKIDKKFRRSTKRNHSATHLLHKALQEIEDKNISQKGSLVTDSYLRFDFNLIGNIKNIEKIEEHVNKIIEMEIKSKTSLMTMEKAKELGAMAIFKDKYDKSNVRVVEFSNEEKIFSIELCGGTHVKSTADILAFKIITTSSIGSGIKRIEAITGLHAISLLNKSWQYLKSLEQIICANQNKIVEKAQHLIETLKKNEKLIEQKEGEITSNEIINELIEKKIIKKSNQETKLKIKTIDTKRVNIVIVQIPKKEKKYNNAEKLLDYFSDKKNEIIIVIEPSSSKYIQYNLLSSNEEIVDEIYKKIFKKEAKNNAKNKYLKFGAPISESSIEKEIEKIENALKIL